MSLKNVRPGSGLSARDLRRNAAAADMARPTPSFGAGANSAVTAGGVGTCDDDRDWFPARVVASVTGGYTFVEQWVDGAGTVGDKTSGRANTSSDPAVVFGSTTFTAGDKILVKRSFGGGGAWWEIAPQPPAGSISVGGSSSLYCEVTAVSFGNHTVKRKTWSSGIVDSTGPVTFTLCRSTTGADLPVGTRVTLDPIPDASGNYWITPSAYASSTKPGLLSDGTQSILGAKTFVTAPLTVGSPTFSIAPTGLGVQGTGSFTGYVATEGAGGTAFLQSVGAGGILGGLYVPDIAGGAVGHVLAYSSYSYFGVNYSGLDVYAQGDLLLHPGGAGGRLFLMDDLTGLGYQGVTGTMLPGASCVKGIVTGLGTAGATGTFTAGVKTVTVVDGIVTSIV